MNTLVTRKTAIAAIISLTVAYPAYAAVPNTFSAGQAASAADVNENFNDLDGRVGALESATATPVSVAINCGADANALKNTTFTDNTTYNITGACNGPIFVDKDRVHLLGGSNATDSIVLPSGLDGEGAIDAGGAYDLQVTNLFLNLTATVPADQAAGIFARDSFVRLSNSRVEGGSWGVYPYRSSIVKLDGINSITEFSDAGLIATDSSNINARDQVTVTSTLIENQYMAGISASRGSTVDIRNGITISVPTGSDPRAIQAELNGSIRIQNSGTVSITGNIRNYQNSSIKIQKGTIAGDIDARYSSSLRMENGVTINGDARIDESSSFFMYGGSLAGDLDVLGSSSARVQGGIMIVGEVDVRGSSNLNMYEGSITGTIEARRGSSINFEDVTQVSDDDRAVRLGSNSTFSATNSSLGRAVAHANSSISIEAYDGGTSSVKGVGLSLGSVGSLDNTSVTGDVEIYQSAVIGFTNGTNLNGNNVKACNSPSYADDSVIGIGNPDTAENDCP